MNAIYLDNCATTCVSEKVADKIGEVLQGNFGNPSSLHLLGVRAQVEVDTARESIAKTLRAQKNEIVFTSGGTESNNLAVFGAAFAHNRKGKRIVTTQIEHPSVLEPMKELEKEGYEVIFLKPESNGIVSVEKFIAAIDDKTILVSCMALNNETGAFQSVDKLKAIISMKKSPALLHCDAVQLYGKYEIVPEKVEIDLLSISAHKIHGPKGIGALYIKNGRRISPRTFGGGQERSIRSGTENVPYIAGFGVAAMETFDLKLKAEKVLFLKQKIISQLSIYQDITVNSPEQSSDFILNISIEGINSETMLHFLEARGIYISTGSACKKGKESHVLAAQGLSAKKIQSAIRISFSANNTETEIDQFISAVIKGRETLIRRKS